MRIPNKPLAYILAIAIASFLAYANTFQVPFQLDDIDNIVNNPAIKDSRYFTDPSWINSADNTDVFDKPLFKTRHFGFLTFAMNYAVQGLDVRGYHLVNLLIHTASAALLYWLILLTFRTRHFPVDSGGQRPFLSGSRDFIALFAALFFAVHPVQTQAVTYIVQRFASLATMLFLLALVMYAKFRLSAPDPDDARRLIRSGPGKRLAAYGVSLAATVLAMKTKEFGMLIPPIIVLYELLFFAGGMRKRLLYLVPFGLAMAILPLTLISMTGALPGAAGIDDVAAKISGAQGGISRLDYLFTQFRVIVTYIRLLVLPVGQAFDHDYPLSRSFFEPQVVISFLFLLALFAGGMYLFRLSSRQGTRDRHLYRLCAFGIFWFFLTLSAESSIIPIADVIFEHRIYLPSIGFFLSMVSGIALVTSRWEDALPNLRRTVAIVTALVVTVLSAATFARNMVWQDSIRLMEDDVRKNPGKARAHSALGGAYAERGRISEAIYHIRTAIALDPRYAEAHYSLGVTYANMGLIEEAMDEYAAAIRIRFEYADAHSNLGGLYAKRGRTEEAIREYRTALMIMPYSADTRNNLGNAYSKVGRTEDAIYEYRTALRIKPDLAEAHYNLGNAYGKLGRRVEAAAEYRTALRLRPDFIEAQRQLERTGSGR